MIEKGTHLRLKLLNTRSDVQSMFSIATIKEDYLGYVTVSIKILQMLKDLEPCHECTLSSENLFLLWRNALRLLDHVIAPVNASLGEGVTPPHANE